MHRIGVDVIILVDIRHNGIAEEIGKVISSFQRNILFFYALGFIIHVERAQIGYQLVVSVNIIVVDRDDDRLLTGNVHHRCNVLADIPAHRIVVHPSINTGR